MRLEVIIAIMFENFGRKFFVGNFMLGSRIGLKLLKKLDLSKKSYMHTHMMVPNWGIKIYRSVYQMLMLCSPCILAFVVLRLV